MKNLLKTVIIAVIVAMVFLGCKDDPTYYQVKFMSFGEVYKTETVKEGQTVSKPTDPTKDYFVFEKWVDGTTTEFVFNTPIRSDIVLQAEWGYLYDIGATGPSGGIVFHRDINGILIQGLQGHFDSFIAYYFEVVPASEKTFGKSWGTQGETVNGILSGEDHTQLTTLGTGKRDTQILINHLNQAQDTDRVAQYFSYFSFGGYNDFFLPSLPELKLFANVQPTINYEAAGRHWSSTQKNANEAYAIQFNTDPPDVVSVKKNEDAGPWIIPIRAF